MQSNKLRMAIRATAALAAVGIAGQAHAFSFSAGDIDAELYGYARLNMSYDINEDLGGQDGNGSQSANPNNISGGDVDGHFGASATQSRIGLRATNADGITINIEGDFGGGDNGGNLRLRHAYGEYNGFLAGQTWSNYNSFVGVTPTLDFNGIVGTPGYQARAAQLRYTTGPMSFSIEDPKGGSVLKDDSLTDEAREAGQKDSTPALTARLEDSTGGLSYSASALIKQNSYDDGTNDDDTVGFGVFGAASFALTNMISIQGAINYTDGASDYLYLSGGKDAYLEGNSLDSISGIGGTLGTSVNLGGGRSMNVAYGITKLDDSDINSSDTEQNQNAFVNYMWTPVQNTMMGVEYAYLENEKESGTSNDAHRVMFAAQYNF
ncbi:hypothetical protein HLV39_00050 [Marinobacter adhaerens]|uniref:Porin n=1 Tax=Marinobacter adhaerens TaxID=1033846 RepID=A0A851HM36_9GAMM|nr:DcaP family trimeric outer membrane transporter [Marinobacter adhaerens]NWN89887.1 hypothetical protein [Marinobacter adhaerens]